MANDASLLTKVGIRKKRPLLVEKTRKCDDKQNVKFPFAFLPLARVQVIAPDDATTRPFMKPWLKRAKWIWGMPWSRVASQQGICFSQRLCQRLNAVFLILVTLCLKVARKTTPRAKSRWTRRQLLVTLRSVWMNQNRSCESTGHALVSANAERVFPKSRLKQNIAAKHNGSKA